MNKITLISLSLLVILSITYADLDFTKLKHKYYKHDALFTKDYQQSVNQTEYNFTEQLLDHFDPTDKRTFTQRYWIIDQYYDHDQGPVIYYICGEGRCTGTGGFPVYLAQQLNAVVFTLEHRFYGASQPFGNASMELDNIKYLTIEQALEDLAYFLNWAKTTGLAGINANTPWITIGGSYPGALSAWFRSKYPYLTVGALASSAVVNPIQNFYQFDQQVRISTNKSGEWCPQGIQQVTQYVNTMLEDPAQNAQIKQNFDCTELSDGVFMFYFADMYAELVQYGQREWLCDNLIKGKTTEEMLQALISYSSMQNSMTYQEGYDMQYLSNTTYGINKSYRQWYYQKCTQVGWWQTAPAEDSLRSDVVNIPAYQQLCNQSFAPGYWADVNVTNLDLGGLQIQANNLIMTNGCEDPWQWASLRYSKPGILSYIVECDDCGHCVDLSTPSPNDPPSLKYIHQVTENSMKDWVAAHWQKINVSKQ